MRPACPGLQIGAGRMEIGEGQLRLDELQMHQPAGRVINEHQQGALRPAIFEPPMLRAVDLHQLANAVAPPSRLVDRFCAACDRATARQRSSTFATSRWRTKSRARRRAFRRPRSARNRHSSDARSTAPGAHRRCRPPVARPPALLGDQTRRARGAKLFQQPPYLALAAPQQLRRRTHRQTTTIDIAQDLETP